jgi:hypothetical protein
MLKNNKYWADVFIKNNAGIDCFDPLKMQLI